MNIPGFAAEAALYNTTEHYHLGTAPNSVFRGSSQTVVHPAIVFPPPCAKICRACIRAGGDCIHVGAGRCECV